MIKNRFVLIDAFALIFRAYYALPPSMTNDGHPVQAAYGFTSALLSAIKTLQPEYLAVGMDLPKPTKRHEAFVEYKAHRAPMPEDLGAQIPFVKDVLKTMNIPYFAVAGYEGEDILATIIQQTANSPRTTDNGSQTTASSSQLTAEYSSPKSVDRRLKSVVSSLSSVSEFIIVTGDLDLLQLIDEDIKVYSMARGVNQAVMYDIDKVKERYGLLPEQFVDFKALKGDVSDNIPGVPGIGEKGAAKLIIEYGNLDKIYENIELISGKVQTLLKENKETAYLSQKLSKITPDAPLDFNLADAKIHQYDQQKTIALFKKLGFRSLINRLPREEVEEPQPKLF